MFIYKVLVVLIFVIEKFERKLIIFFLYFYGVSIVLDIRYMYR